MDENDEIEKMQKAVWIIAMAEAKVTGGQKDVLSLPEKYFEAGDKAKLKIYLEQTAHIMDQAIRKMNKENCKVVQEVLGEFYLHMDNADNLVE